MHSLLRPRGKIGHNPARMIAYALYLHIPFCRQRCSYCDFNTYTTLGDLQAAYVAALAAEIRQVGALAAAAGDPRPAVRTRRASGVPSSTVRQ